MFEYHGWATLRTDIVDQHGGEDEAALREMLGKLREHIATSPLKASIHIQERNNLCALAIFGFNNHRQQPVIDVFQWLADNARCSYGLLYIHDDEDFKRDGDHTNHFRVWKLALGKLEELSDPFLSPYFPTVELSS